jgi:hypothetical protein
MRVKYHTIKAVKLAYLYYKLYGADNAVPAHAHTLDTVYTEWKSSEKVLPDEIPDLLFVCYCQFFIGMGLRSADFVLQSC